MNISQKELAEKLNTSNKNVSKWENAETVPDVFVIKKIASIFNVSIDTLVSPISNENKRAIKTQTAIPFKWKLYVILLINATIFLLACVLFYTFKSSNFEPFPLYYLFIYVTPFMDISVFIFICIVSKKADPITLSIFGWLVTLCFFLTFIKVPNISYIFIIAVAFQILVPIFTNLINTNKIIGLNLKLINRFKKHEKTELDEKNKEQQENITK